MHTARRGSETQTFKPCSGASKRLALYGQIYSMCVNTHFWREKSYWFPREFKTPPLISTIDKRTQTEKHSLPTGLSGPRAAEPPHWAVCQVPGQHSSHSPLLHWVNQRLTALDPAPILVTGAAGNLSSCHSRWLVNAQFWDLQAASRVPGSWPRRWHGYPVALSLQDHLRIWGCYPLLQQRHPCVYGNSWRKCDAYPLKTPLCQLTYHRALGSRYYTSAKEKWGFLFRKTKSFYSGKEANLNILIAWVHRKSFPFFYFNERSVFYLITTYYFSNEILLLKWLLSSWQPFNSTGKKMPNKDQL